MRLHARIIAIMLLECARAAPVLGASAMAQRMDMDDAAPMGMLWFDQLEWRNAASRSAAWQGEGWYGGDYDRAWLRSEGESYAGSGASARAELFWDHALSAWWNLQAGGREDFGAGAARGWAAVGVRGLAPAGVDVEATAYAGAQARTALRVKIQYELLFTQRLILQPEIEMNLYGRADATRAIGAGLADLEVGLRLRYELRREFAPYAGIVWARHNDATAALLSVAGAQPRELSAAVGLRMWW